MSGLNTKKQVEFERHWQGTLSDYVTVIAWAPNGNTLAASSAAGEVVLVYTAKPQQLEVLQAATGQSVDCLAFSSDGQFLAAGGQNGQVKIWQSQSEAFELVSTLENSPAWVDRMAWSPTQHLLAFSLGRCVQVWDATIPWETCGATDEIDLLTTLNFENSSVLDLTWHPDGQRLSVSGYQGVKIWTATDWDDDPYLLMIPSASVAIAWSPDGKYIASGNLDRTITVLEWDNPHPWVMRGFPGKIRQLSWSDVPTKAGASLLAAASAEGIVVWEKQEDESSGWEGRVLAEHKDTVQSIYFQPDTLLLASAAADGWVCLWHKAQRLTQVLNSTLNGFSCLAWHPKGHQLAAGGQNGELFVWSRVARGQGFGQR